MTMGGLLTQHWTYYSTIITVVLFWVAGSTSRYYWLVDNKLRYESE